MGKIIYTDFSKKRNKENDFDYFFGTCVQYRDGKPWCPKIGWYLECACPFGTRYECDLYKEMCGKRQR